MIVKQLYSEEDVKKIIIIMVFIVSQNKKSRGREEVSGDRFSPSTQVLFISLLFQQQCWRHPNTISPRGLKMVANSTWSNMLPCSHPVRWKERAGGTGCYFPEAQSFSPGVSLTQIGSHLPSGVELA